MNFKNGSPPIRLSITMLRVMLIMRVLCPGALKATPSLVGQSLALCCEFMENVHIIFNLCIIIAANDFVVL